MRAALETLVMALKAVLEPKFMAPRISETPRQTRSWVRVFDQL